MGLSKARRQGHFNWNKTSQVFFAGIPLLITELIQSLNKTCQPATGSTSTTYFSIIT